MRREATCFECGESLEETGRNTLYCPSCDTCPECGCPDADGFKHYAGCDEQENETIPCDHCGRLARIGDMTFQYCSECYGAAA